MSEAYANGRNRGLEPSRAPSLLHLEMLVACPRTRWDCAAWIASALGAATLLRLAAGLITSGVPLAFYFPAVSVIALFTGWQCGVIAVLMSSLIAWFLFVPPVYTLHAPTIEQSLILLFWFLVANAQVFVASFLRSALQRVLASEARYRALLDEQKQLTGHQDIQIGELRHRLKNLLTVIQALATSSKGRGTAPEVDAFLARFFGRLHALGAAADLVLAGGRHVSIECRALLHATLSPFMEDPSHFELSGPELHFSEETGGTLGLAFHELATNALKYGALSQETGRVSVNWFVTPLERDSERVEIIWRERGGPPPMPPAREGFGTRLIRSVAARERDGEVQINYSPAGFSCSIAFSRQAQPSQREPAREAAE